MSEEIPICSIMMSGHRFTKLCKKGSDVPKSSRPSSYASAMGGEFGEKWKAEMPRNGQQISLNGRMHMMEWSMGQKLLYGCNQRHASSSKLRIPCAVQNSRQPLPRAGTSVRLRLAGVVWPLLPSQFDDCPRLGRLAHTREQDA
jgi:hypothetical protein